MRKERIALLQYKKWPLFFGHRNQKRNMILCTVIVVLLSSMLLLYITSHVRSSTTGRRLCASSADHLRELSFFFKLRRGQALAV